MMPSALLVNLSPNQHMRHGLVCVHNKAVQLIHPAAPHSTASRLVYMNGQLKHWSTEW